MVGKLDQVLCLQQMFETRSWGPTHQRATPWSLGSFEVHHIIPESIWQASQLLVQDCKVVHPHPVAWFWCVGSWEQAFWCVGFGLWIELPVVQPAWWHVFSVPGLLGKLFHLMPQFLTFGPAAPGSKAEVESMVAILQICNARASQTDGEGLKLMASRTPDVVGKHWLKSSCNDWSVNSGVATKECSFSCKASVPCCQYKVSCLQPWYDLSPACLDQPPCFEVWGSVHLAGTLVTSGVWLFPLMVKSGKAGYAIHHLFPGKIV